MDRHSCAGISRTISPDADVGLTTAARLEAIHPGTPVAEVMARLTTHDIRTERAIVSPRSSASTRRSTRCAERWGSRIPRTLAALLPFMPEPSLLEDLEALAVGVWGKRLLWGALGRVRETEGGSRGSTSTSWRRRPRSRSATSSHCARARSSTSSTSRPEAAAGSAGSAQDVEAVDATRVSVEAARAWPVATIRSTCVPSPSPPIRRTTPNVRSR